MGKIGDAIRAEATSSSNPSYVTGFQAARYRAAQIADRMEAEATCPHIVTSGTTSHCALAEAEVKRLTQENEDAAWWFPQFIVGTTGNMLGLDWQSEFLEYRKQTTDSAHSAATKFLYGKWAKQAEEAKRLREELEALRTKLARAREAFEAVVRNDKTPPYQYHGVLSSLNAENTPPAIGQRWNTPAEIARAFLKENA